MLVIPVQTLSNTHENILIFNFHRREIERFEPHGKLTNRDEKSKKVDESIQKKIVDPINKILGKDNALRYVPATEVCPNGFRGYQSYEGEALDLKIKDNNFIIKDAWGYCIAWSMFYANMRLRFPKEPASELIKKSFKILSTDPQKLREFIRGQVAFAEDMIDEAFGEKGALRKYMSISKSKIPVKDKNKVFDEFRERLDEFLNKKFAEFTG
tara:strand:+ start:46 stop:681 length:636 start_codon:yes stop_codon:yes gene_type:complete